MKRWLLAWVDPEGQRLDLLKIEISVGADTEYVRLVDSSYRSLVEIA